MGKRATLKPWRTKLVLAPAGRIDLERALNEGDPPAGYALTHILPAGGDFIFVYHRSAVSLPSHYKAKGGRRG
jgi:hypothetical protein